MAGFAFAAAPPTIEAPALPSAPLPLLGEVIERISIENRPIAVGDGTLSVPAACARLGKRGKAIVTDSHSFS